MGCDSVDEWNSGHHVGQELAAAQEPPFLGSGLHQFIDHGEASREPLPLVRQCLEELVECLLGVSARLGYPDLMQLVLGFGL